MSEGEHPFVMTSGVHHLQKKHIVFYQGSLSIVIIYTLIIIYACIDRCVCVRLRTHLSICVVSLLIQPDVDMEVNP